MREMQARMACEQLTTLPIQNCHDWRTGSHNGRWQRETGTCRATHNHQMLSRGSTLDNALMRWACPGVLNTFLDALLPITVSFRVRGGHAPNRVGGFTRCSVHGSFEATSQARSHWLLWHSLTCGSLVTACTNVSNQRSI